MFNAKTISGTCGAGLSWSLNTSTGELTITGNGPMSDYTCVTKPGPKYESDAPWFNNRSSIKSVEVAEGVTTIGQSAFWRCNNLTNITLPNSVISIGEFAFSNCSALPSFVIPNNVTRLEQYAFEDCSSLVSVTIGNSVTRIEYGAFIRCGLTSVSIPNGVTNIGEFAFYGCSSLTSVIIPYSVTSIGNHAFYDCTGLTSIYYESSVITIAEGTFKNASPAIYVPQCAYTAFHNAPVWKDLTIVPVQINMQVANNVGGVVVETCSSMEIEAIPFEGYHFMKWLDGNADNPRGYSLSQSNLNFIAQFEINKYTISLNCDANQGSVTGDKGKFEHGSDHTIEAVPNYGYHFTQWSDGETDNPRTFVLEQDTTFIALFAQNATFNITIASFDETQGVVTGSGEYYYGEIVTLTAIPNKGYYFDSWSDELTDNPRELKVTSDLELSPLFKECKEIVTSLNEVIVKGSSYDFGGQTYTQKGTYRDTIVLENGCDSIVVLKLNVIKSKTCNLRLVINDENMGTVEGSGTFQQGQQVTVTATPASSKYIFVRWYNEDEDTESTENPYTFTLNSNLTLRAVFRKAPKR